jgi:hypothetical protein
MTRVFALACSFVIVSCGATRDAALFDTDPEQEGGSGAGGATAEIPGAGGGSVASTGGAGTRGTGGARDAGASSAGSAGSGPVLPESDASSPTDADATTPAHMDAGSGGSGGAGDEAGTPSGAWSRCSDDSDCVDGRVCTATAQSILVSGRDGACVRHCLIGPGGCDAPLPGASVSCTQLLIDSFCTFTCAGNTKCPEGFDCVSGACFYAK